jgi:hypothetical protein
VSEQVVSPSDGEAPKDTSGEERVAKNGAQAHSDGPGPNGNGASAEGRADGEAARREVPQASEAVASEVQRSELPGEAAAHEAAAQEPGHDAAVHEVGPSEVVTSDEGVPAPSRFEDHVQSGRAALSAAVSSAARTVQRTAADVASAQHTENAAWKQTEDEADLPDLKAPAEGGDPLFDLAVRLDREASFHRTLAVRALRPGPGRLLAVVSGSVALVGGTMLALAAGIRAFFGAGIGDAPGADAAALSLLLAVSAGVGLLMESEQRRRAQTALGRAELAERRLERIAAILALKEHDTKRFGEALTRLEREPTR